MKCPFCHGEIDEQYSLLDHMLECQRLEQERWQREFDAGLRRLLETVDKVMAKVGHA